MKIERLTISNFRGVKGQLELEPNQENVVLVGSNGTGKSSVIAAVDFLLTGSINELTGEGARHLSEKRHGPHVDVAPEDSWVEGKFRIGGQSATVRRELVTRDNLAVKNKDDDVPDGFEAMADAADRGLHLLSRDELLDFITAKDGTRSERVRSLLNLQHVQDRRLALDNAATHFETQADKLERESETKRSGLRSVLEIDSKNSLVLKRVNELRTELNGDKMSSLHQESFREGIESPSQRVVSSPLLRSDGRQLITELQEWIESGADEFLEINTKYQNAWEAIDADQEAIQALQRHQLIKLGWDAVDPDAEQCPLCLRDWDTENLTEHLNERLEAATELKENFDDVEPQRDKSQKHLTNIRVVAESLKEILSQIKQFDEEILNVFVANISEWEDGYDGDLTDSPPKKNLSKKDQEKMLRPDDLQSLLENLQTHIEDRPQLDELESSWNTLSDAETRYSEMIDVSRKAGEYRRVATNTRQVHAEFIDARDTVLNRIYDEIESRFEKYYTALHGDEAEFSMSLKPTETGLNVEVGFFERGQHPPHALHSEGHQDSMGICLYFALCDWLKEREGLSIMMLDDVVMSIDAEHRRPLANLMATDIADEYQMFITTHDDLWHRHLRSAGVVNSSNAVQFSGWNIESGPQTLDRPEMEWETISELLDEGNTSMAAHQTRRMAEWFLREACHRLDGKVPFKANSEWNLGDFKDGVLSRYKDLIGKAKAAEDSWNRGIDHLEELENRTKDIARRVDEDGAALNPNVHWNEAESAFANCTASELEPAVAAYRDLYQLLWCDTCDSCVRVVTEGSSDVNVRCSCNKTNINLRGKS